MSWGTHPDTLCMASAQGAAERSGHKSGTIAWLKAYREAYAKTADKDERGLPEYLKELDNKITAGIEPVWWL